MHHSTILSVRLRRSILDDGPEVPDSVATNGTFVGALFDWLDAVAAHAEVVAGLDESVGLCAEANDAFVALPLSFEDIDQLVYFASVLQLLQEHFPVQLTPLLDSSQRVLCAFVIVGDHAHDHTATLKGSQTFDRELFLESQFIAGWKVLLHVYFTINTHCVFPKFTQVLPLILDDVFDCPVDLELIAIFAVVLERQSKPMPGTVLPRQLLTISKLGL